MAGADTGVGASPGEVIIAFDEDGKLGSGTWLDESGSHTC
jgi:hypothetical protein